MPIEKKALPVAPLKGLYVDGMTVPGGLSQAENIDLLPNGWVKRRAATRTLAETVTVKASQGFKELFEFRNSSGNRYLFADLNVSTTMSIKSGAVTGTTDYEVSWADVITGLTAGTSILPQWAVMQDRAFRVDGTNTQYVFSTNSAYTTNGVTAPSAAPSIAETTGGSLTLLGEYNCYYTYVRKSGTYVVESDPSPVANITLTGSNNAITITIVSSADTSVTHIRMYRTLYGEASGSAYYEKEVAKATYVATPGQTFTLSDDAIGDSGTTLETDNDAPPTSIGLAVAGGRMFYLTKTKLYWSKREEPEHVPPTWYSALDPNDGDIANSLVAMQTYVLVFKRHKTYMFLSDSPAVDETGNVGISRDLISPKIGCVAPNSVQSCGEQNCAMWLSHEGVMQYSGGEIRNVSKDKVNSIIFDMLATANTEYFIDSAYYNKKYHLLIVTRNAGSTLITDERHLVYHFETDSWTEYKYYATDNTTRYYEVNLAITTDSNNKEVFLVSIALTTGATSQYIYQTDYAPGDTGYSLGVFNETGQTDRRWHGMCSDDDDNVYAVVWQGDIYKNTGGATGTFTALGETSRYWSGIAVNNDNGNVYACTYETYDGGFTGGDIYMQTAGSGAFVSLNQHGLDQYWSGIAIDSNGNVYACSYGDGAPGTGGDIYKQTAGTGNFVAIGGTHRNWYGITVAPNGNIYACVYGGDIYMQTAGVGAFVALNQTARDWSAMTSDDDGNIYAVDYTLEGVYKRTLGAGDFNVLQADSGVDQGLACTSGGEIYGAAFYGDGAGGDIYVYLSNGYWSDTVDAVIDSFWASESYTDSTMDIDGVLGRIVSNYEDLTVANHKRICRAYMDTMSEYATCGVFSIEADYGTNLSIHANSESSEPSGAVSRAPFATSGDQTWNTNSSFSSGTVENWQTHRLDVGLSGRKFRYSIKFGDISGASQGSFYLKPPSFDGQIKGKY